MIVIPVGQSNLYVEPLYLQAEVGRLPEMKRVILASGNQVIMEPTVEAGLAQLFGPEIITVLGKDFQPGPEALPAASPPVAVAPARTEEAAVLLTAFRGATPESRKRWKRWRWNSSASVRY